MVEESLKEIISKPILLTEDIKKILTYDISDERIFSRLWAEFKSQPNYLFELGETLTDLNLITEALNKRQDLENQKPELYRKYRALILYLRIITIPALGSDDLEDIFTNHILFAFDQKIDLMERVYTLYLLKDFLSTECRRLRRSILYGLERNKELIGQNEIEIKGKRVPPTIGHWISDYNSYMGFGKFTTSLDQTNYLMESKNAFNLGERDKLSLLQLVKLYDYISLPELTKNYNIGADYDFSAKPTIDQGTERAAAEASLEPELAINLDQVSVEPTKEGLKIYFGGKKEPVFAAEEKAEKTSPEAEKIAVEEKEEKKEKSDTLFNIQARIADKNRLFADDERRVLEAEKQMLAQSGGDGRKIKDLVFAALDQGEASKMLAGLFILSRAGEIFEIVNHERAKSIFPKEIFPLLLRQNPALSLDMAANKMAENKDDPAYFKIFLKYIINKVMSGQEEKAAYFAVRLENIFAAKDKDEYLGLAYYNLSSDRYEWAAAKVKENGQLEMT